MIWNIIALISAFSVSLADSMTKKYLSGFNMWVIFWVRIAYTIPFLCLFAYHRPIPILPASFWFYMIPLVILEITAGILYVRAIQISPLSLTIPFMAFSPVFLLIVGYVILGEKPSPVGLIGILTVSCGAYTLNIHHNKTSGLAGPLKAVFKEKGSWMMLLVAFLYSFSASFGKKTLLYCRDPYFFSFFYMSVVAVVSFPLMLIFAKGKIKLFVKKPVIYLLVGTAMGIMVLTHFMAVLNMNVAYMISLKRMNLVFSIFLGHWLFNEERLIQNTFACIMMILGAFLVSIA